MPTILPRAALRLSLLAGLATAGVLQTGTGPARAANGDSAMFTLDSVTFSGNQRVSTDKLNGVVGIAPGDKVNRDSIVNAFNNVTAEYGKENVGGSIQPKMTLPRPGHMAVVFDIAEDAPPAAVKVALVLDHETFTGNVHVSSDKLQPALTIKPGDTVTTEKVAADQKALGAVYTAQNIASSIQYKAVYPTPGHVDLNFEITEKK